MCAIAEYLCSQSGDKISIAEKVLRLSGAMCNRGPDAEGRWTSQSEQVRLAHPDPVQFYQIAEHYLVSSVKWLVHLNREYSVDANQFSLMLSNPKDAARSIVVYQSLVDGV